MKNLIFTLILSLISISCIAQKTVKTTQGHQGKKISYVSSTTFNDLKINSSTRMKEIAEAKTIEDVIGIMGKPLEIKKEKDTAIDGTVLLKRKLVIYPGLLLVFPEKENEYRLSRIDYTSKEASLEINGDRIKVGMNLNEISEMTPYLEQSGMKGSFKIYVEDSNASSGREFETSQSAENVKLSKQSIKLDYDQDTKEIKKLSILMYTI